MNFKEWFKDDEHDFFHYPEEAMEEAWKAALKNVMPLLVIMEPAIDDWNYPLGMKDDIKKLCDEYYGEGIRPDE